ncbi:recombinase family protein [Amphritea sp.]|uniref:recombinase family protein n=1 Tax=Amphritea sp. TaxID=1872502 RepID=UPI0025C5ACEF|nr:recombinase family protein [Amphritea sp.]
MSSLIKPLYYTRVSSGKQTEGTSLQSQLEIIDRYSRQREWDVSHADSYSEVASGRRPNQLTRDGALRELVQRAKDEGRPIVVARLDRLTRDLEVAVDIFDSGITIHEAENNDTINKERAISYLNRTDAERQQKRVSQQSAYQKKRDRGEIMGNPDILNAQQQGAKAVKNQADDFAKKVYPEISKHLETGLNLNQIAKRLIEEGVPTQKGAQWSRNAVDNVIKRYNSLVEPVHTQAIATPEIIEGDDIAGRFS